MFTRLAAMVREGDKVRQLRVRDALYAAGGRTHVAAFIVPDLLLAFHRVVVALCGSFLGGGSERGETPSFVFRGFLHDFLLVRRPSPLRVARQLLQQLFDAGEPIVALDGKGER